MLETIGEGEGGITADKISTCQAGSQEGNIALPGTRHAVIIQEQAPPAILQTDGCRRFKIALFDLLHPPVKGLDAAEGAVYRVSLQQHQPVRVSVTFDKQVVLPVFLIHRGIDDRGILLQIQRPGLGKMPEIPGGGAVDAHVFLPGAGGGPVQHVFKACRITDHVRRPQASEAFIPQPDHFLLCPVDQILRFPVGQILAAESGDVVPAVGIPAAHAVGQGEIRRENMEAAGDTVPDNGHVPDSVIPVIGPEYGPSSVQRLPVKAVPAQGKMHLLSIRRGGFPKMHKQIVFHKLPSLKRRLPR